MYIIGSKITIIQGDTSPTIRFQFKREVEGADAEPVNFTDEGITSVGLTVYNDDETIVDKNLSIYDYENGLVDWTIGAGETDSLGVFYCELKTNNGETFPSDKSCKLYVI